MAIIDIDRVQVAPIPEAIRDFALDTPLTGDGLDVYDMEIAGWVIGAGARPRLINIQTGSRLLRTVGINQSRPDVSAQYPEAAKTATVGFRTSVNVVGLEPNTPLSIWVVLTDGSEHLLAKVRYRHQPLVTGYTPRLLPMMLTTLGRAGTTWTMRLLSEHPRMVIHRSHPYEVRAARHWLHSFKILTEPRNPHHSAQADTFQNSRSWAGHNPFYPQPLGEVPGVGEWFGKTYIEDYAGVTQRWIDTCYQCIAQGQGVTDPIYFAEKHRPDDLPWLVWELYPRAKEVFLVRDFRDVIASMLSFNAKHGRRVFGPDRPISDEDFVRFIHKGPITRVAEGWAKRHDQAHLVRYEDLIQEPVVVLREILNYLELDASDTVVTGMLERASEDDPEMQNHRTSANVSTSIGRWRSSLAPSVQSTCEEVLGPVLQEFGYEV